MTKGEGNRHVVMTSFRQDEEVFAKTSQSYSFFCKRANILGKIVQKMPFCSICGEFLKN